MNMYVHVNLYSALSYSCRHEIVKVLMSATAYSDGDHSVHVPLHFLLLFITSHYMP